MKKRRMKKTLKFFKSAIDNPWPRPGLPRSSGKRSDVEDQQNQEHAQSMSRQGGQKSTIP